MLYIRIVYIHSVYEVRINEVYIDDNVNNIYKYLRY